MYCTENFLLISRKLTETKILYLGSFSPCLHLLKILYQSQRYSSFLQFYQSLFNTLTNVKPVDSTFLGTDGNRGKIASNFLIFRVNLMNSSVCHCFWHNFDVSHWLRLVPTTNITFEDCISLEDIR